MNLNADPNSPQWGRALPKWQSEVGSVLVVRKDGKNLTAKQCWAMAESCALFLRSKFEASLEASDAQKSRKDIVEKWLTKDAFEKYLGLKKLMVTTDDPAWAGVASLYSI
jgi:hypothetical protein